MANNIQTNNIQAVASGITESVLTKVKEMETKGGLAFPRNYSYANALRAAQLVLLEAKTRDNKPVLEACSKESVLNTLLSMVTKGLNVSKNQCYFIPYGNQLQLSVSYLGKVAMTKRLEGVKDVKAYALYDGDVFMTEFDGMTGRLLVKEYKPQFSNINAGKVIGAFAMIIGEEGVLHTEVMTITQIQQAWGQGAAKGNSGAHKNFTEEMAKKTVINRAVKMFVNASDDSDLDFGEDDFMEQEYKTAEVREAAKETIAQNANQEVIDIVAEEAEGQEEGQPEPAGVPF